MRDPNDEERRILSLKVDQDRIKTSPAWEHLMQQIHRLKDDAVERVLRGLDQAEYTHKLGFIEALDAILRVPGELDELNEQVKDSLNAG